MAGARSAFGCWLFGLEWNGIISEFMDEREGWDGWGICDVLSYGVSSRRYEVWCCMSMLLRKVVMKGKALGDGHAGSSVVSGVSE